ncbi:MAG TPA: type II secretion system protein [Burkholderiales bacterium]|nr:type II secretion system protein [Burkholderiales bacterium]
MATMRSRGFTYMTVLFIVAVITAGLALVGEMWETAAKREKETQLLFVGNEYRKAITRYYLAGKNQYPRALEDLLKDPRQPGVVRYLRRLYPDPLTGAAEWGIVKAPDGGIAGVYSLSEDKPLKTANFKVRDAGFEGAQAYSAWKFIYSPVGPGQAAASAAKPGATPAGTAQPGTTQPGAAAPANADTPASGAR